MRRRRGDCRLDQIGGAGEARVAAELFGPRGNDKTCPGSLRIRHPDSIVTCALPVAGLASRKGFAWGKLVAVMSNNFHENYAGADVKRPSERSTGLVFGAVAAIIAILWRNSPTVPWLALAVAMGLTAVSLFAPALLKPLNALWFQVGLLMHRIVNPVVMFAMFALVFVPAGMIMRIWRDPLRLRPTKAASTYWIERKKSANNGVPMTNQF
jgi:hypothetical protein